MGPRSGALDPFKWKANIISHTDCTRFRSGIWHLKPKCIKSEFLPEAFRHNLIPAPQGNTRPSSSAARLRTLSPTQFPGASSLLDEPWAEGWLSFGRQLVQVRGRNFGNEKEERRMGPLGNAPGVT